jgi:hypothetical protein
MLIEHKTYATQWFMNVLSIMQPQQLVVSSEAHAAARAFADQGRFYQGSTESENALIKYFKTGRRITRFKKLWTNKDLSFGCKL